MIDRSEAEDHLRVIRSLMEKATIYRALSAPAALAGGILSLAAAALVPWLDRQGSEMGSSLLFGSVWAVVFVATAVISLLLLQRDAAKRGEPFLTHGARSAFRAMLPPMGVAACFTVAAFTRGAVPDCAPWWIASYGLALVAMMHFAPRSITILGWCFVVSGAIAVTGWLDLSLPRPVDNPSALLGFTFGLFHVVYAACAWPRASAK